ncbi:uncharacterized protein LOC123266582 [Cotesia glomerata]|uniref:uncharacterized protein LOC123266582 n=1 Tax=Cotesia glomerata TaxID=32391 RepID=UPI001D026D7F|nr:uncharacterized protein LOC123266582 [Cotesia glomerata]
MSATHYAQWDDVEQAYRVDKHRTTGSRVTKLTDEHIYVKKIKKMRVRPAAQIMSRTVANLIKSVIDSPDPIETTEGQVYMDHKSLFTAEILNFFNDLFDSINGSPRHIKTTAPLRATVTADSPHHEFWARSKYFLGQLRFLDPKNTKRKASVPTLDNWKLNVEGFMKLWKILSRYEFKEFSPRNFNQDDLESTFGWLRQKSCNKKPSCRLITSHLRSFLIDKVGRFKVRHGNTEHRSDHDDSESVDFSDIISTFNNFLIDIDCVDNDGDENNTNDVEDSAETSTIESSIPFSNAESTKPKSNIIEQLSRHNEISQQLMKVVECRNCKISFVRKTGSVTSNSSFDLMYFQVLVAIEKFMVTQCYKFEISKILKLRVEELMNRSEITKQWSSCLEH